MHHQQLQLERKMVGYVLVAITGQLMLKQSQTHIWYFEHVQFLSNFVRFLLDIWKKWLSALDQNKEYHQIYFAGESQPVTTFVTPWGLCEWIKVAFGLTNAPAVFQRFTEVYLFDIRDEFGSSYLHDIIVSSEDFKLYLDNLRIMFRRLKEKDIKINSAKCKFFQREVNFVGRVLTEDGYKIY